MSQPVDPADPPGWSFFFWADECRLCSPETGADWSVTVEGAEWSPHPLNPRTGVGVPGLRSGVLVRFSRIQLVSTPPVRATLLPRLSVLGMVHRSTNVRAGERRDLESL